MTTTPQSDALSSQAVAGSRDLSSGSAPTASVSLAAKVASMSEAQKEARVQALYTKDSLTDEEAVEFGAIMLGGI